MDSMYNSYPSLEYAVDTVTSSALYQAPQMTTPPNSATSTLSSMSNPAYLTNVPGPTGHKTSPPMTHVSSEYLDMEPSPTTTAPTTRHSSSSTYRTSSSRKSDFPYIQPPRHSRTRTPPSDDEVDELTEEPPAPNAPEQEKQDYKRRQNTLAARRSRKRKILYTQSLEMTVERLTMEKEVWKTRALTLKQLLQGHGIPCPDFTD